MPDFSTISQSPQVRALVQENLLQKAFHDSLFPRILFRGEAAEQLFPNQVGDSMIFTGPGLMGTKMAPVVPGTDPTPSTYQSEQWEATIQQYADSIDTHMPTSISAIVNLFYRNAQQLGLGAAQSLNRIVRDRMYNAGLSGQTVATNAAQLGPATGLVVPVARLNGLTTARAATATRFTDVSAANPLAITIGTETSSIVAFAPTTAGDRIGPGTITLNATDTVTVGAGTREAIITSDASNITRVGGGNSIDAIGVGDLLQLTDIRTAVNRFWQQNVPEMPDGRFHAHLSPTSQGQVFNDSEFRVLLTAMPDYYMYKQFALGELLGTVFLRNSECPIAQTVQTGAGGAFSQDDPFAGELVNATNVVIQRVLFVAQGAIYEYYQDLSALVTEAGVTGKVGEPSITNNGINVYSDRIQLVFRSPLNRLQDLVSTSWKFIGDWPVRTDVTTGDSARFKRLHVVEHGQPA